MTSLSYPDLFRLTGRGFAITSLLARLPLAMSQMGTMLLVSSPLVAGRMGPGGAAAGAVAAAIAVGSPIVGAFTDRHGQRTILLVQSIVAGLGLIGEAVAALCGAAWPVIAAIGVVIGLFLPQVGTMARVRWRQVAAHHPSIRAGVLEASFAWEGAVDEASFALGPALVGILGVIFGPVPALIIAGVILLVFGSWFAVHPTVRLVAPHPATTEQAQGRLLTLGTVQTTIGILFMGLVFGTVQTGTTSLATQAGQPGYAGLLHALLSIGSASAGLLLPRLARRLDMVRRWQVFALGLAVLSVPLLFVHTLGSAAIVMVILGLAAAPYMITLYSSAERVTPASRLGTVMTLLAATTSLGYAVGAAAAGRMTDLHGPMGGYGLTVAVGAMAFIHALCAARPVLVRAESPVHIDVSAQD